MPLLRFSSLHLGMLPSIRDITVPLNEVSSLVEANRVELYLSLIPTAILIYDSRTSSFWTLLLPSLMLYQFVHWTKRYVNRSRLNNSGNNARLADQILLGE